MRANDAQAFRRMIEDLKKGDPILKVLDAAKAIPVEWRTKPVGLSLRRLRIRQGLTQMGLAAKAAVPPSFVCRLEYGQDMRLSTLTKLYQAMGYKVLIVPMEQKDYLEEQ